MLLHELLLQRLASLGPDTGLALRDGLRAYRPQIGSPESEGEMYERLVEQWLGDLEDMTDEAATDVFFERAQAGDAEQCREFADDEEFDARDRVENVIARLMSEIRDGQLKLLAGTSDGLEPMSEEYLGDLSDTQLRAMVVGGHATDFGSPGYLLVLEDASLTNAVIDCCDKRMGLRMWTAMEAAVANPDLWRGTMVPELDAMLPWLRENWAWEVDRAGRGVVVRMGRAKYKQWKHRELERRSARLLPLVKAGLSVERFRAIALTTTKLGPDVERAVREKLQG